MSQNQHQGFIKATIIFMSAFLFFVFIVNAQIDPLAEESDLTAVFFNDPQTGLIIGHSANQWGIFKTIDGGESWQQRGQSSRPLHGLKCKNQFCLAVGDAGTILKSLDSGQSWENLSSGTTQNLFDLEILNSTSGTAIVVGSGKTVRKTVNGGTSWSAITTPGGSVNFTSVHFSSSSLGWITGGSGVILKTSNGGASWTSQNSGVRGALNDVFSSDGQNLWVVGVNGLILKSNNGGTSFSAQTSPSNVTLKGVYFLNNSQGYIVGRNGVLLVTTDSGQMWETEESESESNLESVHCTQSNCVVVGANGTLIQLSADQDEAEAGNSTSPSTADLAITEAHYESDSNLKYTVVYSGAGQSPTYNIKFQWLGLDGAPIGESKLIGASDWPGTIIKETNSLSSEIRYYLIEPPSAASKLRITIDESNLIVESSETNNAFEVSRVFSDYTVSQGHFDVQDLVWTNQNQGVIKNWYKIKLRLKWLATDGSILDTEKVVEFDPISGGTGQTVNSSDLPSIKNWIRNPPIGAAKIQIKIDSDGSAAESNEDNNLVEVSRLAEDLKLEAAQYLPDGNLSGTFIYQGVSQSGTFNIKFQWLNLDGNPLADYKIIGASSPQPGQPVNFNTQSQSAEIRMFLLGYISLANKLRITLDESNLILESDETNNIIEIDKPKIDYSIKDAAFIDTNLVWKNVNLGNIKSWPSYKIKLALTWLSEAGQAIGASKKIEFDPFNGGTEVAQNSKDFTSLKNWVRQPPTNAFKMRLKINSDGDANESDLTNNVLDVPLAPEDLAVISGVYNSEGKLTFKHKYIGPNNSRQQKIGFQWINELGEPLGESKRWNVTGFPGEITNRNFDSDSDMNWFLIQGLPDAAKLQITLDPDNEIAETDEANNLLEIDRPSSDYTFKRVSFVNGNLTWRIANIGSISSWPSYDLKMKFTWLDTDSQELNSKTITVKPLNGGAYKAYNSKDYPTIKNFIKGPPANGKTLKIVIDSDGYAWEANEDNNSFLIDRPLPDLVIKKITWRNSGLSWKNVNQGNLKAERVINMVEMFNAQNKLIGDPLTLEFGAIESGHSNGPALTNQKVRDFLRAIPDSVVRIVIHIDKDNQVTESNESNNYAELEYPPNR